MADLVYWEFTESYELTGFATGAGPDGSQGAPTVSSLGSVALRRELNQPLVAFQVIDDPDRAWDYDAGGQGPPSVAYTVTRRVTLLLDIHGPTLTPIATKEFGVYGTNSRFLPSMVHSAGFGGGSGVPFGATDTTFRAACRVYCKVVCPNGTFENEKLVPYMIHAIPSHHQFGASAGVSQPNAFADANEGSSRHTVSGIVFMGKSFSLDLPSGIIVYDPSNPVVYARLDGMSAYAQSVRGNSAFGMPQSAQAFGTAEVTPGFRFRLSAHMCDMLGNAKAKRALLFVGDYIGVAAKPGGSYDPLEPGLVVREFTTPANVLMTGQAMGQVSEWLRVAASGPPGNIEEEDRGSYVATGANISARLPRNTLDGGTRFYPTLYDEWKAATYRYRFAEGFPPVLKEFPFSFKHYAMPVFNLTEVPFARITLLPTKSFPTPGNWTIFSGSGGTVGGAGLGALLSAGAQAVTFKILVTPPVGQITAAIMGPYRYLYVPYTATKDGNISVTLKGPGNTSPPLKRYDVPVSIGSGILIIDTADPSAVSGIPASELGERQYRSAYSRYSGFGLIEEIRLTFSDNKIRVTSPFNTKVVRSARIWQGHGYGFSEFGTQGQLTGDDNIGDGQYQVWGEVDGLDAYRTLTASGAVDGLGIMYNGPFNNMRYEVLPYVHHPGNLFDVDPPYLPPEEPMWMRLDGTRILHSNLTSPTDLIGGMSYNATGVHPGLDDAVYGGAFTVYAHMIWGNVHATSTIPALPAESLLELVNDDPLPGYLVDEGGWGAGTFDYFSQLAAYPFRWDQEQPSERDGVWKGTTNAAGQFRYVHMRHDIKGAPSVPTMKQNIGMSWGHLFWSGVRGRRFSDGLDVTVTSGKIGYFIAQSTPEGLKIDRAWHDDMPLDFVRTIDEAETSEPRLAYDADTMAVSIIYLKEGNSYRLFSHDWGDTWVKDPLSGDPFKLAVMHHREVFNPRTDERLFLFIEDGGTVLKLEIYNNVSGDLVFQLPAGIGGVVADNASFDAIMLQEDSHLIDVVFLSGGERVVYRSAEEGRSWVKVRLNE